MATLNCMYLNHLVESRFHGEIYMSIFGSLDVRHVVWSVTYVTVLGVPAVIVPRAGSCEISRELWDVETHPIKCASLHVRFFLSFFFSFIHFLVCWNVFHLLFWTFGYHKIWILLIFLFCLFYRQMLIYSYTCICLPLSRSVLGLLVSVYHQLGGPMQ